MGNSDNSTTIHCLRIRIFGITAATTERCSLLHTHLHSSFCRKSHSPARANQPPSAVNVVHLLSRDPGPRLVVWGNGDSVLPPCETRTNNSPLFFVFLRTKNKNQLSKPQLDMSESSIFMILAFRLLYNIDFPSI